MVDPANLKTDKGSILQAHMTVLKSIIQKWAENKISDQEVEFLSAFIKFKLLPNKYDELPEALKAKIGQYRELEKQIAIPRRAPGVVEAQPVDQPLLLRGDYKKEDEPVKRAFLEVFDDTPYKTTGSGRLELAQDIVSAKNPLKSRLLVNRLWAYIFGKGIVKSTDNFGRLGDKPTHPELLDYLAQNFEKNGWSIKKAIREMVTSRTFKSVSQSSAQAKELDSQNKYLSYFTPRRLDAEAIWDSIHALANQRRHRAVYDYIARNRLNPFLTTFNRPTPFTTVSTRLNTNVPDQALSIMNDVAHKLALGTQKASFKNQPVKTNNDRVKALYLHCLSRLPNSREIEVCLQFIEKEKGSWALLTESLLNSKEIIYVH
jgi:hypothetical protein